MHPAHCIRYELCSCNELSNVQLWQISCSLLKPLQAGGLHALLHVAGAG